MLPEPMSGSYDWARAGDAMMIGACSCGVSIQMPVLWGGGRTAHVMVEPYC